LQSQKAAGRAHRLNALLDTALQVFLRSGVRIRLLIRRNPRVYMGNYVGQIELIKFDLQRTSSTPAAPAQCVRACARRSNPLVLGGRLAGDPDIETVHVRALTVSLSR